MPPSDFNGAPINPQQFHKEKYGEEIVFDSPVQWEISRGIRAMLTVRMHKIMSFPTYFRQYICMS